MTLVLAACAVALAMSHDFYVSSITSEFFAVALVSTLILHLRVRPYLSDVLLVIGGTLLLGLLGFRILGFPAAKIGWLSFAGMSSMLVLGIRTAWAEGKNRKLLLYAFFPAFLFVASEYYAGNMLYWTTLAHPKTLDLYLYAFDASLHAQISFLAGRLYHSSLLLRGASFFFYIGLPLVIAFAYAEQLVRRKEKALPVALAFLLTGPLGVLFYNLFPAVGPIHTFRTWPAPPFSVEQVPDLVLGPLALRGPRNAMPSLHMAWVLLALWYTRRTSWWARSVTMAFVIFTVLATMGTGEHYFVDLVVAFPFALMIRSLFSFSLAWNSRDRIGGFVLGAAGTVLWLSMLRFDAPFFLATPVLPWAFVAGTVAGTVMVLHSLQQAEERGGAAIELRSSVFAEKGEETTNA